MATKGVGPREPGILLSMSIGKPGPTGNGCFLAIRGTEDQVLYQLSHANLRVCALNRSPP
jgi:hypothetical protein